MDRIDEDRLEGFRWVLNDELHKSSKNMSDQKAKTLFMGYLKSYAQEFGTKRISEVTGFSQEMINRRLTAKSCGSFADIVMIFDAMGWYLRLENKDVK